MVFIYGEATTLSNIGGVYQDTKQPDKAIANLEASINITLDIRKELSRSNRKAFIEAKNGTAIALVDLLIKQNQPQKAYEWANLVTTTTLIDYNRLINAKVANQTELKPKQIISNKIYQEAKIIATKKPLLKPSEIKL